LAKHKKKKSLPTPGPEMSTSKRKKNLKFLFLSGIVISAIVIITINGLGATLFLLIDEDSIAKPNEYNFMDFGGDVSPVFFDGDEVKLKCRGYCLRA